MFKCQPRIVPGLHDSGIFLQKLSQLTLSKPEESVKALGHHDL